MPIVETKKEDKKENKVVAEKSKTQFLGKAGFASRFLIEPWITEKSHEHFSQNKYIFKVNADSTKSNVKKSIEDLYKVSVIAVNMINIHPKKRIYGRSKGFKAGFKKAIVTLKEGDKIELFEGV